MEKSNIFRVKAKKSTKKITRYTKKHYLCIIINNQNH